MHATIFKSYIRKATSTHFPMQAAAPPFFPVTLIVVILQTALLRRLRHQQANTAPTLISLRHTSWLYKHSAAWTTPSTSTHSPTWEPIRLQKPKPYLQRPWFFIFMAKWVFWSQWLIFTVFTLSRFHVFTVWEFTFFVGLPSFPFFTWCENQGFMILRFHLFTVWVFTFSWVLQVFVIFVVHLATHSPHALAREKKNKLHYHTFPRIVNISSVLFFVTHGVQSWLCLALPLFGFELAIVQCRAHRYQ